MVLFLHNINIALWSSACDLYWTCWICVHSLDVSDIVGVVALPWHPMCVPVLTVSVYCSSLIWFPIVSFPLILVLSDFGEVHVLLSNGSLQLLWGSVQGDNPSQRCVIRWSICRGIYLGLGVWCRKTCTFQLWVSFWTWNVRLMLFELRPKMCLRAWEFWISQEVADLLLRAELCNSWSFLPEDWRLQIWDSIQNVLAIASIFSLYYVLHLSSCPFEISERRRVGLWGSFLLAV